MTTTNGKINDPLDGRFKFQAALHSIEKLT